MSTLGRVKCAILGSRGLVAQRLLQRLSDHHWLAPVCIVGSSESEGMKVSEIPWSFGEPKPSLPELEVIGIGKNGELASHLISIGVRIVFSALPDSPASYIEEDLARAGLVVISHSTIHRHSKLVPLVVPEANKEHLGLVDQQKDFGHGILVACPNCMVVPLAISIATLIRSLPARKITIITEQSLSGGGRPMLEKSRQGHFPDSQILGESLSVERELKRILGKLDGVNLKPLVIDINAKCRRVNREFGHSASVTVEFERSLSAHEVIETWSNFLSQERHSDLLSSQKSPLNFVTDIDSAISLLNLHESSFSEELQEKTMSVFVGGVEVSKNVLRFDVASDNTVRGAAGNSVLLAELMMSQGVIYDTKISADQGKKIRQA